MDSLKQLSGKWSGNIIDVFGGTVWRAQLDMEADWSGRRLTGSGRLTSLVMPNEPIQPIEVKGSLKHGQLILLLVAPDRFESGVCWQHTMDFESGQDSLTGAGYSWESTSPDVPDAGEPGGLRLTRVTN